MVCSFYDSLPIRHFDNYRNDEQTRKWIQERMWKFFAEDSAGGAGAGFEGGKLGGEGFEDAGAEGEVVEFALAADVDEAGGFQLLDVVGKGGGGDGQRGAGLSAGQRAAGFSDALEKLEAPRIGEGLENGGASGTCEAHYFL
jgi:hypothetical protein